MDISPAVVWAGRFDEGLDLLITVFASAQLPAELSGPSTKSLFFNEHTVETLCNAVIKAEDAVICTDTAGNKSFYPTSILAEAELPQMFNTEHSPYFGPLMALANIVMGYSQIRTGIDPDAYIYRPLKKNWSRMIRHISNHPARSLTIHDIFRVERYLVPLIFCKVAEAERSFASVIDDDCDLTISLITRYWIHATGEAEIREMFIFFLMLIPRRADPGSPAKSLALYLLKEEETDTTITLLRRILQNTGCIAEFVQATASHLRRFPNFETTTIACTFKTIWDWARAFQEDALCSEFLRVVRTSAPLWSSIFNLLSRSTDQNTTDSFADTSHGYMIALAVSHVNTRNTSAEATALTELWVSTGVFDALDASLGELLRHGTEDEQVKFSNRLARIYHGVSYGPDLEGKSSYMSLIRQQLPRPRTVRRLWDISLKLSGTGVKKVAPSHSARLVVMALELLFILPNACMRRGCEKKSTAKCAKCKLGYCGVDCQKRDWKDHKMVCGITMDMEPDVRDEAYSFIAGEAALAKARAEMAA